MNLTDQPVTEQNQVSEHSHVATPSVKAAEDSAPPDNHSESPLGRRGFIRGTGALLGTAVAGAAAVFGSSEEVSAHDVGGRAHNFRHQLQLVQRHENAHVRFLVGALGEAARPKPTFRNLAQRNFNAFMDVSRALENTGVGAYLGAAPAIFEPAFLAAAGSIALVEARHAGFFNAAESRPMTENAFGQELDFERAFTVQEVVANAGPFVANLNGGPPLTFDSTPSPANDIAILNFALALEYLEADFYNVNVPRFGR